MRPCRAPARPQRWGSTTLNKHDNPFQYVHDLLVDEFDIPGDAVRPEASLFDDLGIDSIDAVDMIVHMREVTGGRITPERFKTVRTVQDVVDLVDHVMA